MMNFLLMTKIKQLSLVARATERRTRQMSRAGIQMPAGDLQSGRGIPPDLLVIQSAAPGVASTHTPPPAHVIQRQSHAGLRILQQTASSLSCGCISVFSHCNSTARPQANSAYISTDKSAI
jgi:hypothetical protein